MNNLKPWNKRKRTSGVKRKLSKASMDELQRSSTAIYKLVSFRFTHIEGSAQILLSKDTILIRIIRKIKNRFINLYVLFFNQYEI